MSDHLSGRHVVGLGAGSLDFFPKPGDVGSDHKPGGKSDEWTAEEQERLDRYIVSPEVDRHTGGNVINILALLAVEKAFRETSFVGVLGHDDAASHAVRGTLEAFNISNRAKEVEGYRPSVSIIERALTFDAATGQPVPDDRMVRGRPRGALDPHLDATYLSEQVTVSDLLVVSSLKSMSLTEVIFELAAEQEKPFSYTPGGSEFTNYSPEIMKLLNRFPPYLLALNDGELRKLTGDKHTPLHQLALQVASKSQYLLCTRGEDGLMLVHDGQIAEAPRADVPEHLAISTIGAGDGSHARALVGLERGDDPQKIAEDIAEYAGEVVQHLGAHSNLHARLDNVAQEKLLP